MRSKHCGVAVFLAFAPLLCLAQLKSPAIPVGNYTAAREMEILNEANAANGETRICVDEYIASYQNELWRHCVATDGGKGIGGGCEHVAKRSLHGRVIELALAKCKGPTTTKVDSSGPNQLLQATPIGAAERER